MKKLLELEARLVKAKEELEKSLLGDMNPISSEVEKMDGAISAQAGAPDNSATFKAEEIRGCQDRDKAKKIMEEEMDDHNEDKHDEDKDEDSAKKSDIPKSITDQTAGEIIDDQDKPKPMEKQAQITYYPNGQWSLEKADVMDPRANGEFDVPVKDVYNGDDGMDHVGSRSVDGDKKGKTEKPAETEKKLLKG